MNFNLIAFMVCTAVCIYTSLQGRTAESVICFLFAVMNLLCVMNDLFSGGRPA